MYIDQGYVFPRLNDASQAAANVTGIQAALNIGGTVRLAGSGVCYINAPLVIGSNTKLFLDQNLTIRLAPATNNNLLQNAGYSRAFSNISSVTWTAGLTASVVWPSHGQSVSNYVWLHGAPSVAASITVSIATPGVVSWTAHGLPTGQQVKFATTGALPTGITAGQIYYVSATGNSANAFQISSTYQLALAGTSIATSGSQSGTQTAQSVPDSAYTGVFMVSAVTDANTVVIDLYRLPLTTATGAFTAKQADQNIIIEGGIWDYDYNNNSAFASNNTVHIAMLTGIQGLTVRNVVGTNAPKYFFNTGGLRDYKFENISSTIGNSGKAASDVVHLYGPSFSGVVDRVYISPGVDDGVTMQPANPSAYAVYNYAANGAPAGDILDVHVSHVDFAEGGTSSVLSYSTPGYLIDNIEVEKVFGRNSTAPVIRLDQGNFGAPPGSGKIGSVRIRDVRWGESGGAGNIGIVVYGPQNIDRLEIDGVVATNVNNATGPSVIKLDPANGAISVNQMVVRGLDITAYNQFYAVSLASGSVTVDSLTLSDSVLKQLGSAGQLGYGVYLGGSGLITKVTVERVWASNILALVSTSSSITSPMSVTLTGNYLNQCFSAASIQAVTTTTLSYGKNTSIGGGYPNGGFARIFGTSTTIANIYSDGGNVGIGAGLWIAVAGSTPTLNLFAEDFQVDVTTVARVNGGKLFNTNAAAGTLGAAGVVDSLGTAASSWHLRGTPTLVY